MTNPLLRGMLAVLPLVAMGCIDSTPSSGQCTVTFNGQTSTWTIDPGESHFYREDDILGDEDAPVALRYGGGQVRVQGELDDMPTSSYVGTHRVPSEDRVRRWDIEHAPAMSSPTETSVTFTTASRDRLVGEFQSRYTEGTMRCSFNLRRAWEHDTDD